MEEQIPDKNLFMMCRTLNKDAVRKLPSGFYVRTCKENELDIWKAMPFDTSELAKEYYGFMTEFFHSVYLPKKDLFYEQCLFVCNSHDKPVGTCFVWKSYNTINTLHWFKVLKEYEGMGIGRALLSIVMERLNQDDFPVFLHTQPESFRAVKLYSDFGFCLLSDPVVGNRKNDLLECLPILKNNMPKSDFEKLQIVQAPKFFLDAVSSSNTSEF